MQHWETFPLAALVYFLESCTGTRKRLLCPRWTPYGLLEPVSCGYRPTSCPSFRERPIRGVSLDRNFFFHSTLQPRNFFQGYMKPRFFCCFFLQIIQLLLSSFHCLLELKKLSDNWAGLFFYSGIGTSLGGFFGFIPGRKFFSKNSRPLPCLINGRSLK